jgi:hypothetical protein
LQRMSVRARNAKHDLALQLLADQAQELDMGYGNRDIGGTCPTSSSYTDDALAMVQPVPSPQKKSKWGQIDMHAPLNAAIRKNPMDFASLSPEALDKIAKEYSEHLKSAEPVTIAKQASQVDERIAEIEKALAELDAEPVGQQSTARDFDYFSICIDKIRASIARGGK